MWGTQALRFHTWQIYTLHTRICLRDSGASKIYLKPNKLVPTIQKREQFEELTRANLLEKAMERTHLEAQGSLFSDQNRYSRACTSTQVVQCELGCRGPCPREWNDADQPQIFTMDGGHYPLPATLIAMVYAVGYEFKMHQLDIS